MDLDLLRRLSETPGIAGREERVRDLILAEVEGSCDEVRVDPMGSLICTVRPRREPAGDGAEKVMIACHMDEIGFYVRHVDEKGFVWIHPAGGFDPRNLFARRVTVCTADGDLPGVLNPKGKPVHLATAEERRKVPKLTDFFVDLGLDGETAAERVAVGDFVVMDEPFVEIGGSVVGKALDNRMSCWLGIEALRALASGEGSAFETTVVFTVQEEVGLRGAGTSAYTVRPDIGFAVDTTLACDTPGVGAADRVSRLGEGVVLKVMDGASIADRPLLLRLEALAREREIPYQKSVLPRGGTDAGAVQRAAGGARTLTLAVGTRYIHTVTEMIHRRDLGAIRDLVVAFLEEGVST